MAQETINIDKINLRHYVTEQAYTENEHTLGENDVGIIGGEKMAVYAKEAIDRKSEEARQALATLQEKQKVDNAILRHDVEVLTTEVREDIKKNVYTKQFWRDMAAAMPIAERIGVTLDALAKAGYTQDNHAVVKLAAILAHELRDVARFGDFTERRLRDPQANNNPLYEFQRYLNAAYQAKGEYANKADVYDKTTSDGRYCRIADVGGGTFPTDPRFAEFRNNIVAVVQAELGGKLAEIGATSAGMLKDVSDLKRRMGVLESDYVKRSELFDGNKLVFPGGMKMWVE